MDHDPATELSCRELVELVTGYLDDALPARDRARSESHLADCEGCRRYVAQMRATIRLTRRAAVVRERPETGALVEAFRGSGRR